MADTQARARKDRRTDRLLRKPEVSAKTGMSVSAIYRLEMAGCFPRRLQIGLRAVGWYESDIDEFIADPRGYRSDSG
ncbi:helix-turn-helix transcriptional regulator [Sphingobium sp. YG1]|uniref:helix-turn-helix transcriptional regulator n=1 Tax=Sphingobium sp. YG1 TaxID=2082188 RepID=UPI0022B2695D|nr:AlpA family phage regulatory protein [Sphingobium sp. YG1]